jgi:hypothetical protein
MQPMAHRSTTIELSRTELREVAPPGGGQVGALMRQLDASFR